MGATKHFHTCRIDDPHAKNGRGRIDVFSPRSAPKRRCMWNPQFAASNSPFLLGLGSGQGCPEKHCHHCIHSGLLIRWSRVAGALRARCLPTVSEWSMAGDPRPRPQIAAAVGVESRAAHHSLQRLPTSSALTTSPRCSRAPVARCRVRCDKSRAASRRNQRMARGRLHPSAPRREP